MPFAGYTNFKTCVAQNRDKKDPEAYCASIMHQVEDKGVKPTYEITKKIPVYGRTNANGHVQINPKKGDVVNTIIHEQLHNADWNMPHDQVYRMADKIEGEMTLPQMADKLLQVHEASLHPRPKRDWKHTTASKIISSKVK